MSATHGTKKANRTQSNQTAADQKAPTAEVLYQRMGNRWFAFSLIGDDVYVGSIPQDEVLDQREISGNTSENEPKA